METIAKCIAVDDEAPALKIIEQFVSQTPEIELAAVFRNPVMAAGWMAENRIDILFLDIQMPQQSGIEMLRELSYKPLVVFTTAFSEFAIDAFDLDAIDYLRKPFSYERFLKAVKKATEHIALIKGASGKQDDTEPGENYVVIKTDGKIIKVFFEEILYVEGFQEYIKIHTSKGRYITYQRMKNMDSVLPASMFMRVHRSYIVSLKHILSISGNMLDVEGHQIPVSKDMKEELIKRAL